MLLRWRIRRIAKRRVVALDVQDLSVGECIVQPFWGRAVTLAMRMAATAADEPGQMKKIPQSLIDQEAR